jgi:hypothetical protein
VSDVIVDDANIRALWKSWSGQKEVSLDEAWEKWPEAMVAWDKLHACRLPEVKFVTTRNGKFLRVTAPLHLRGVPLRWDGLVGAWIRCTGTLPSYPRRSEPRPYPTRPEDVREVYDAWDIADPVERKEWRRARQSDVYITKYPYRPEPAARR